MKLYRNPSHTRVVRSLHGIEAGQEYVSQLGTRYRVCVCRASGYVDCIQNADGRERVKVLWVDRLLSWRRVL